MITTPKVPVGLASWAGYLSALAVAVLAAVEALEASGQAPGSVKWLAIISAGLVAFTNHGRQAQAAAAIQAAPLAELPSALEEEEGAPPPAIPASALESVPEPPAPPAA